MKKKKINKRNLKDKDFFENLKKVEYTEDEILKMIDSYPYILNYVETENITKEAALKAAKKNSTSIFIIYEKKIFSICKYLKEHGYYIDDLEFDPFRDWFDHYDKWYKIEEKKYNILMNL